MTAVPDEGTSQLNQAQVIGRLLVVAHQYRPALGQPAQGAFHDPTPGLASLLPDWSSFSSPMRRIWGRYPNAATALWPVGLSYPLSRHRFWAVSSRNGGLSDLDSGRATTTLSKVRCNSFVSWTLAPATTTLRGPPSASTKTLFLLPALPRSVGLGPMAPPKTRFAYRAIRRLPFPVHAAQLLAFFYQDGPDALQRPTPYPALEGTMDGAIVPQLLGHVVPLATASQPKDDPFQHLPLVHPFAHLGFGRVQLQYHRFDSLPKVVGNIPNSR